MISSGPTMEELTKFWDGLAPGDKHLIEKKGWAGFIAGELLSRIKEPISTVVDYGCGGGWIDLNFSAETNIHLFDICQESLDEAEKRLKQHLFVSVIKHLTGDYPADPSTWKVFNGISVPVDLLICTLVVNHFPDLIYYQDIVGAWCSLKPKYIILHQRHSDETVESADFEDYKMHYGSGLTMSTADVLHPFSGEYTEIYHTLESATFGKWNTPGYEFFILKRK